MLPKGEYQHYRGGVYKVLHIAKHSETADDVVVYQNVKTGDIWVRPLAMWNEEVKFDGKWVRRFTQVYDR